MTDVTSAELAKVLKQHAGFVASYEKSGTRCMDCQFEKHPCIALRMATEIMRRREIEGKQGELLCP